MLDDQRSVQRVRQEVYISWSLRATTLCLTVLASDVEFLGRMGLLQFKRSKTWLHMIIWDSNVCTVVLTCLLHTIYLLCKPVAQSALKSVGTATRILILNEQN